MTAALRWLPPVVCAVMLLHESVSAATLAPGTYAGDPPCADCPGIRSMRGMFRYMADAGIFRECLTDRSVPVAQEADNAALERAYLAARAEPGAELLVDLEGTITRRPPMEGTGERDTLVVTRFIDAWPGRECLSVASSAPALEDTLWKLTRIRDAPVAPGRQDPFIELVSATGRIHGASGCNRFQGGYERDGQTLRFTPLATTRMACAGGMDQESHFLEVLTVTARWQVAGEHLTLYDAAGERLAVFAAEDSK